MGEFPYEAAGEPASVGMDKRGLDQAVTLFRSQYGKYMFPGGQLCVRRGGKAVLNEAIGTARGWRKDEGIFPVEVRPETPFPVLSAGKPLGAVAVAMLEDRGVLDVGMPVAEWIPEFSRHGKGEITILDVLTHRTGLSLPGLVADLSIWHDRQAVLEQLVDTRPVYPRGTMMYAAYEYGWILSEVFVRAAGRPLAEFVEKELCEPREPLGLPALKYGLAGRELSDLAYSYWLGKDKVMVSKINVAENFERTNNSLEQIESLNPAVSLVSDAASLAAFYEFLVHGGVTRSGERLISEEVLRKYTTKNVSGLDKSSGFFSSLGRGFMVGSTFVSSFGWWNTKPCFGHLGGFSSLAFGDHERKLAAAIVTNGNRDFFDVIKRFLPLCAKLRKACR